MINFDDVTICYHPYRILLIISGSRSGNTNSLFNLISHKPDIDKIVFMC